jgi:hypothetical protein
LVSAQKEEEEIVRAFEAEWDAYSLKRMRKRSGSRPPSDPPVLGEPDAPIYAPLRPKPNLRSGAIALPQPESEDAFMTLEPRRISK